MSDDGKPIVKDRNHIVAAILAMLAVPLVFARNVHFNNPGGLELIPNTGLSKIF